MFIFNISKGVELVKSLLIFILGIVIYSIFIFKFYRFIAKKNMFKLDLNKKYNLSKNILLEKILKIAFYLLEYIIAFPIVIFIWSSALTILIVLMSNDTSQSLFLLSLAVVGAIRITAYYSEDLSKDLAKLLPFSLLGAFIVNSSSLNINNIKSLGNIAIINYESLIYYFIFIVILEFVLRIWHSLTYLSAEEKKADKREYLLKTEELKLNLSKEKK